MEVRVKAQGKRQRGKAMNLKHLNVKYALTNIGYLLLLCGTMGYAYNYLSQSGFDDGTAGMIITAISLAGVIAGPAAGALVDRSSKITQKMFIVVSMVVTIALAFVLALLPSGSPLIMPVIIIDFMSASIGMPLLNGMAFIYEKEGGVINYGLCRGLGSVAYAVGSSFLGRLWSAFGKGALPVYIMVAAAATLFFVMMMPSASAGADASSNVGNANKDGGSAGESISLAQFFVKYRDPSWVVVALVLMFFCHFLINNFMAKVVGMFVLENVETVQGNAMFIAAMLELPTMFGFSLLLKRFSVNRILAVSSVFFSLKHIITFVSTSVPMFYFAMALQMLGFAALVPAVVYFANEQVAEEDRNKGQAIFSAGQSVGALVASFVGGWLFTLLPTRAVLGVGAVASVCGTLLMMFVLRKIGAGKS